MTTKAPFYSNFSHYWNRSYYLENDLFLRKLVWPQKPKGSTAFRLKLLLLIQDMANFYFYTRWVYHNKRFWLLNSLFLHWENLPYINKLWRRISRKLSKGLLYLFFVYKASWDPLKIKKQIMIEVSCDQ